MFTHGRMELLMNKVDQHERLNLINKYVELLRHCVESDDLYTIESSLTIIEVLLEGFNKEFQKDLLTENDLEMLMKHMREENDNA